MRDSSVKRWSRLHALVYKLTRGAVGDRLVDNDMLLLTTTARKSGEEHTVPLLYLADHGRLVVIASYGGRDHHPDWYLNLSANPAVEVLVGGSKQRMMARTASPDERAEWWPRVVEAYNGYGQYQARTCRQIPVVFLEPAG